MLLNTRLHSLPSARYSHFPTIYTLTLYSYNKTNEMHYFHKIIFGIELYMFRQVFCPSSGF